MVRSVTPIEKLDYVLDRVAHGNWLHPFPQRHLALELRGSFSQPTAAELALTSEAVELGLATYEPWPRYPGCGAVKLTKAGRRWLVSKRSNQLMPNTLRIPDNNQKLNRVALTTSDPAAFRRLVLAFDGGRKKSIVIELMALGGPVGVRFLLIALTEGLISCDDAMQAII